MISDGWSSGFLERSALMEPLRADAPAFGPSWPGREELQRLLDEAPVRNASGMPLRLVPHARRAGAPREKYEARVYLRGELPLRERNWHDLLNVLVWRRFPRAKAALNARHYAELGRQTAANRGPVQDALTLFDEGGIIVAASQARLLALLREFRWKELFWRRRDDVRGHMRFTLFGHAIYEKALAPFAGITARAILLETGVDELRAPLSVQLALADERVAARLADHSSFSTTRELVPVPVLGVPGWCPDNEREDYYDDPGCFRPGRKRSAP